MKNAKVIALPEVREYLSELIHILYEKEYFGFEESAQRYLVRNCFEYCAMIWDDQKITQSTRKRMY